MCCAKRVCTSFLLMEKQTDKDEVVYPGLHGQETNRPLCCLFKTFPGLLRGAVFLPPLRWTRDYSLGPTSAQSGRAGWGAAAAHGCFSKSWWEQPHGVRLSVLCCVLGPKSPFFFFSKCHHLINMSTPLSSSPPSRSRLLFSISMSCSGRTTCACLQRKGTGYTSIHIGEQKWMDFYIAGWDAVLLLSVSCCLSCYLAGQSICVELTQDLAKKWVAWDFLWHLQQLWHLMRKGSIWFFLPYNMLTTT